MLKQKIKLNDKRNGHDKDNDNLYDEQQLGNVNILQEYLNVLIVFKSLEVYSQKVNL